MPARFSVLGFRFASAKSDGACRPLFSLLQGCPVTFPPPSPLSRHLRRDGAGGPSVLGYWTRLLLSERRFLLCWLDGVWGAFWLGLGFFWRALWTNHA